MTSNKNVLLADIENVGHGHRLQKLYLGYYTADFN